MFTHLSDNNMPQMVDISEKIPSHRFAHARSIVSMPESVMSALSSNSGNAPKGPVFQTAIVAGIMGAKRTSELIPLCHPLSLSHCSIEINIITSTDIEIDCRVQVDDSTGVEMEALLGASIAALTIYDMCKALTHDITIKQTVLVEKTGGKNTIKRNEGIKYE